MWPLTDAVRSAILTAGPDRVSWCVCADAWRAPAGAEQPCERRARLQVPRRARGAATRTAPTPPPRCRLASRTRGLALYIQYYFINQINKRLFKVATHSKHKR